MNELYLFIFEIASTKRHITKFLKGNYGYNEMETGLFNGIPYRKYLEMPLRQKVRIQRNIIWTKPILGEK